MSSTRVPHDVETRLFINGNFVPSVSGKKIDVYDPFTEELTTSVYEAREEDVDKAVQAARAAFSSWSALGGFERAAFLYRLADLYEKANGELARLEAISMGRPVGQYTEGIGSAKLLRYYAGKATDVQGESSLQTANFVNLTFRQPYGVCGAIVPWNAPVTMLTFKLAACLVTGNTLVAKSSEKTPLTALVIARLVKEAQIPAGVVNILSGTGPICGNAIARHLDIRKISFTGSARAGRAIKIAAAQSNLKNVSLELGGKSPLIIFEDADIEMAVPAAANSILGNSGQQCIASTRIYMQRSIMDQFCKLLVVHLETAGSNHAGNDPLSQDTLRGPQADKTQFESIMKYLESAKSANYKILTGGTQDGSKGYFIHPTLIYEPEEKSDVMQEEIFGPVQCIAAFDTEEEALQRSNSSEYGLYASVYTKDLSRALRVAKAFEAGSVGVNCTSPMMTFDMPFGGWKQSGEGKDLSAHSLATWTELKSVYVAL